MALQVAGIIPRHFGKIPFWLMLKVLNCCFILLVYFSVLLDAPDTVLIERAVGKRIDPQTGGIALKNSRLFSVSNALTDARASC